MPSKMGKSSKGLKEKSLRWYTSVSDPVAKWFATFDSDEAPEHVSNHDLSDLEPPLNPPSPSSLVALDCEMVVVKDTSDDDQDGESDGEKSSSADEKAGSKDKGLVNVNKRQELARVSIVDYHGTVLLDTYCKPKGEIIDYKTRYSGVTAKHLEDGKASYHNY
jgi:hypothetical protein